MLRECKTSPTSKQSKKNKTKTDIRIKHTHTHTHTHTHIHTHTLKLKKKNFMVLFYGWCSTPSRLQNHYEETVYFLPLGSQKFVVLI